MIKTERTIIIPLEQYHLESLRKMRNDSSTWKWLTDARLINQIQQEKWFEKISLDMSIGYYAIEEKGTASMIATTPYNNFIGIIRTDCLDQTNRSIRIGLDIHPNFRKKGYATEAFGAFLDYLFKQQNMHRIWFLVAKPNKIARKLYEKFGFIEEGEQREALYRDGTYWDYVMMGLLKKEYLQPVKVTQADLDEEETKTDEIPF